MYYFSDSQCLNNLFVKENIANLSYGALGDKLGDVFEAYIIKIFSNNNLIHDFNNSIQNSTLDFELLSSILKLHNITNVSIINFPRIPRLKSGGNPKTDVAININDKIDIKLSIKQSCAKNIAVAEFDVKTITQEVGITDNDLINLMIKHQSDSSGKYLTKNERDLMESLLIPHKKDLVSWCISGSTNPYSSDLSNSNTVIFFKMGDTYKKSKWIQGTQQDLDLSSFSIYRIDDYSDLVITKSGGFGTGLSWTYATGTKGKKIQFKAPVL